jgi:hypothetical protein
MHRACPRLCRSIAFDVNGIGTGYSADTKSVTSDDSRPDKSTSDNNLQNQVLFHGHKF